MTAEECKSFYRRFAVLITRWPEDESRIPDIAANNKAHYNRYYQFFKPNPVKIYRWSYLGNHAMELVKRAYNKAFGKQKHCNVKMVILEGLTKEEVAQENKKRKEEKAREKRRQELETQPGLFNDYLLKEMRTEDILKRKKQNRQGELR